MNRFWEGKVVIMPPVSTAKLERQGIEFLRKVAPSHLSMPRVLDVLDIVENILPYTLGIRTYPASPEELGPREGATDPTSDEGTDILILNSLWNDLLGGGRQANRARATIMHEIAHAYLHAPIVRRVLASATKPILPRARREEIPVYQDPEWQAWTLAGCMIMPSKTLLMLDDLSPRNVGEIYGVSESFATAHLRRSKIGK